MVSPDWVLDSYAAGHWQPELAFELTGDSAGIGGIARGRAHGPHLFRGLKFLFAATEGTAGARDARASHVGPRKGEGTSTRRRGATAPSPSCMALDDESAAPSPKDLEHLARRGGAEILSFIGIQPDSDVDLPHLSENAREGTVVPRPHDPRVVRTRKDTGAAGDRPSPQTPWWRRPIVIIPSSGAGGSWGSPQQIANCPSMGAALRAAWVVLPSGWMMDCISLGELLAPPLDWLAIGREV